LEQCWADWKAGWKVCHKVAYWAGQLVCWLAEWDCWWAELRACPRAGLTDEKMVAQKAVWWVVWKACPRAELRAY